jgi:UDP-GlcNAc3NAcA epimerase
MKKILTVVGARPQFIKAAPLSLALIGTGSLREIILHTGQHYDYNMSEVMFRELKIPEPAYFLDIQGGRHGDMTGRMLMAIESVIVKEMPDAVLVYGDTNSTLAGALAAAKLQVPLIHVEAGLRSYNRRMPEEINRITADHLSQILFCPTGRSVENLATEGIKDNVHFIGDIMFDATLTALDVARRQSKIMDELNIAARDYNIVTLHRAENTDDPRRLKELLEYVVAQAGTTIFPLHPRTRTAIAQYGYGKLLQQFRVVEPLGYIDMTWLLHHARTIYTDSGGIQKEAYFHRVPCVTLREETEWVETIDCGWNRLWQASSYTAPKAIADYGTGQAAKRIASILASTDFTALQGNGAAAHRPTEELS